MIETFHIVPARWLAGRRADGLGMGSAPAARAGGGCGRGERVPPGPGDVVRITVYQNPDLTLETRVTEAGVVQLPAAGQRAPRRQ